MARMYRGWRARLIGAGVGVTMLTTGLGMCLLMGVAASNVPLPDTIEPFIRGVAPLIRRSAGDRIPLVILSGFGLISLGLIGMGIQYTAEALRKTDYSVRVT